MKNKPFWYDEMVKIKGKLRKLWKQQKKKKKKEKEKIRNFLCYVLFVCNVGKNEKNIPKRFGLV